MRIQKKIRQLESFAVKIGLAFQIKDDLLDACGDEKILGKKVGKDFAKKGFVKFLGIEKSEERLKKLTVEAIAIVRDLKSKKLEKLAEFISTRES